MSPFTSNFRFLITSLLTKQLLNYAPIFPFPLLTYRIDKFAGDGLQLRWYINCCERAYAVRFCGSWYG